MSLVPQSLRGFPVTTNPLNGELSGNTSAIIFCLVVCVCVCVSALGGERLLVGLILPG